MNLHEKCLLKYLAYPDELSYATEILKLNNDILQKRFLFQNFLPNIPSAEVLRNLGSANC